MTCGASFDSVVKRVTLLAPNIIGVLLARPPGFEFRAGQFVQLSRPSDGLMRPYSIASLPSDDELELHVALLAEWADERLAARSGGPKRFGAWPVR